MFHSSGFFMYSYGYLSNTKVKFLMVTTDLDVKDADIRTVSFLAPVLFVNT